MEMTPEEILIDFNLAKRKKEQVQILADLNLCKPSDIIAILEAQGVDKRSIAFARRKPEPAKKMTKEEAISRMDDALDHGDMDKAGYYADRVKQLGGIADSGDRTEFSTGAVRDMHSGKGRMDLLPWAAIMEVSKHCENGALKYGEHNVDKGIPLHSLIDSGMRHLAKFADGWTDEPHLLAASWNILWAVQMTLKYPELCDVPWRCDG